MAVQTLYFGIESLNLTAGQKNTLITGLQSLGDNASASPNRRNHSRIRLDNNAIIFEAAFETDNLTIDAIKQRLATIFNVAVGTITHSTASPGVGFTVTFIQGGQNRIRMISFGMTVAGTWPSWTVSNQAVRDYLIANSAAWGDV